LSSAGIYLEEQPRSGTRVLLISLLWSKLLVDYSLLAATKGEASMKLLSTIAGFIGLFLLLLSLIGRVIGLPYLVLLGSGISFGSVLLLANTAFVLAIFLRLPKED
jgi:hypothetical protein